MVHDVFVLEDLGIRLLHILDHEHLTTGARDGCRDQEMKVFSPTLLEFKAAKENVDVGGARLSMLLNKWILQRLVIYSHRTDTSSKMCERSGASQT
ncbi:hypothetical protein ACROYT_G009746 [Oculina patagonica]